MGGSPPVAGAAAPMPRTRRHAAPAVPVPQRRARTGSIDGGAAYSAVHPARRSPTTAAITGIMSIMSLCVAGEYRQVGTNDVAAVMAGQGGTQLVHMHTV
jgi:hypothetical protein